MPEKPKRSLSLLVCKAMIEAASRLVPPSQRIDWKHEWQAEIWHRWQFLFHAGTWSRQEALLLLRRSTGCFPDALWHLTGQDAVQTRLREWLRSPWTCLGGLLTALVLLAAFSAGFPATRGIFQGDIGPAGSRLVFIWLHPSTGGGDKGLPSDVAPAWATRTHLLEGVAPFVVSQYVVGTAHGGSLEPLVVKTQISLFKVLNAKPALGRLSSASGVVISDTLWRSLFHADPNVIGKKVRINRDWHQVVAVMPSNFQFLSRQPTAFFLQPSLPNAQLMILARVKPGISTSQLNKELTRVAETACYYFFRSELRYSYLDEAAWIPVKVFAIAALCSALLAFAVSRIRLARLCTLLAVRDRKSLVRRTTFFSAKVALAFLVVFTAALEWSRSQSAILYGSRDPAAGPFLLWLYILGTMGVLFWAVADQRARCRVCLRLLCFPVRVGCPGCLLLNWSGTELLCSEGHGLLHVPHMAPSWDEESEHWISLDESWQELFAEP
jgi:MacB-like periplasmic core domain